MLISREASQLAHELVADLRGDGINVACKFEYEKLRHRSGAGKLESQSVKESREGRVRIVRIVQRWKPFDKLFQESLRPG